MGFGLMFCLWANSDGKFLLAGLGMNKKEIPEWAIHKAAQLWCLPRHSHKEMDSELAEDIAKALSEATDSLTRKLEIAECAIESIGIELGCTYYPRGDNQCGDHPRSTCLNCELWVIARDALKEIRK